MTSSVNNGLLTWTEFDKNCGDLHAESLAIHDDWVYKTIKEEPGFCYLEKRVVLHLPDKGTVASATVEDVDAVEEPQDATDDEVHILSGASTKHITCVYHVVYSQSYNVPVLYFNMFKSDGRLLTLDEIWHQVPNAFQAELRSNSWGAISQQEHPLLGLPYFFIHPCQTETVMKSCLANMHKDYRNYIITWLSMFGPLVGLILPLSYGKMVKN